MRVSLCACSGTELLEVDGDPAWQLSDVLEALREQDVEKAECRTRIFSGGVELRGTRRFDQVGVAAGGVLTVVRTPALRMVGVWKRTAKVMSATTGQCSQATLPG